MVPPVGWEYSNPSPDGGLPPYSEPGPVPPVQGRKNEVKGLGCLSIQL